MLCLLLDTCLLRRLPRRASAKEATGSLYEVVSRESGSLPGSATGTTSSEEGLFSRTSFRLSCDSGLSTFSYCSDCLPPEGLGVAAGVFLRTMGAV